jgi:hypothetical protein
MYFTYTPNQFTEDQPFTTYDLVLHTDEQPDITKEPILKTDDTTYWYGETDEGFVAFGISHNYRCLLHEPGYMWSSRASVFNGMFRQDICCKEVLIKLDGQRCYGACAMTLEAIYELLDEDKEIALYEHWNDNEIRLEICDCRLSPNDLYGDGNWLLIDTIAKV